MKLPSLYPLARRRTAVTAFGGYNHTESCGETEFYSEENLSARRWPALAPRLPRTLVRTLAKPHGLYAKNGLLWVDGTTLYYNGAAAGTVADSDKTFCGIGAKVLIWPDKMYFDLADQTLHPLGAKWAANGTVRFAPAREDGTEYDIAAAGASAPCRSAICPMSCASWGAAGIWRRLVLRRCCAATASCAGLKTSCRKLVISRLRLSRRVSGIACAW